MRIFSFALIALSLTGCTALTDLDDFETATCTEMRLQLDGLDGPHGDQMVEVRGISSTSRLQSLVVLDPIGSNSVVDIRVPGAFEGFGSHIDFYADVNDNGIPEAPPNAGPDHSWVIEADELLCADQDPTVTNFFPHQFDFVDLTSRDFLPIGTGAFLTIENVEDSLQAFELRISTFIPGNVPETRTVGVWRRPKVSEGDFRDGQTVFNVWIPYVIDSMTQYTLEIWNDSNGNQRYDPPPIDESYVVSVSDADIGCAADGGCVPDADSTFDLQTLTPSDIGSIYVIVDPDADSN